MMNRGFLILALLGSMFLMTRTLSAGMISTLNSEPVSLKTMSWAPLVAASDDALAELGLEDDENSQLFLIAGIILMGMGVLIICGRIFYYFRPQPVPGNES